MVGTKSSNRCETCRQRKVKCDETWPICGPCRKGHRSCSGPPKKEIRFFEPTNGNVELPMRNTAAQALITRATNSSVSANSGEYKNLHMVTLRSTRLRNGGHMQKIRLVDVPERGPSPNRKLQYARIAPSPALSLNESLSARLRATFVATTTAKNQSHGMLLRELLGRFGNSAALDDTAMCLVSSHEAVVRGDDVAAWFNTRQYGKALHSIQAAIDNPKEQYSLNTLAAISIMWRMEAIFCTVRGISNQAVHGRALAKIFKHRRLRSSSDPLEILLVVDCLLGDVQASATVPCASIFDTPEWDVVFSSLKGHTLVANVYLQMGREFVKWPGLVHDIVMLQVIPGKALTSAEEILRRAIGVATTLDRMSQTLDKFLSDPKICVTCPSPSGDLLVPEIHQYLNVDVALIVAYHTFYSLTVHRMIEFLNTLLPHPSSNIPALPTFYPSAQPASTTNSLFDPSNLLTFPLSASLINRMRLQNVKLSQRVWMMHEHVRIWKPIGCLFFLNALKASFPCADTPVMREWILIAMSDVEDFLPEDQQWDAAKTLFWCRCLTGEAAGDE